MTDKTKTPEPKKLTPNDPVPAEVIKRFHDLEEARGNIGLQLLSLEQNKIRLLAVVHQLDEQKQRMFEQVLMERGLPPETQVEINSTGVLKVLNPLNPNILDPKPS
jgi:hypothetical protein